MESGDIHCCEGLARALADETVPLDYSSTFREYTILRVEYTAPQVLEYADAAQRIDYCPWCGRAFPGSLRVEWFDALEQLGLDDPWAGDGDEVPEEFNSDAWWRMRGL